MGSDWTTILTGMVEHQAEDSSPGITMTSFNLSGDPEANAIVNAVASSYEPITEPTVELFEDMVGQKVTILRKVKGAFGHAAIEALSGTVFSGRNGAAILPKGKRTKGYSLTAMCADGGVIDVLPGYNKESVLTQRVNEVRGRFPELTALTQADLDALPRRSSTCTLAVFGTYPFVTGRVPATIWLCHSYMKAEDIVESVLFIDPAEGESEHGSCYGRDLLRFQVGKVAGFVPVSFKEAINMTMTGNPHQAALDLLGSRV